jgi:membrane protein
MLASFDIPLSWGDLLKRTAKETNDDDCLGLAAQLAYYFFLALFPAILFVLALASFFPLTNVTDEIVRALRPIAPAELLGFLEEQLRRLSNADSGGILTVGILGAVWSSSAAVVAITGSLNRAYDIEESRPWWKVRLTAIGLTVSLALMILISFTLILAGPTIAEQLARSFGFGAIFEWTWKILQWPLAFLLVSTAVGLVYYFAPDAEQDWVWITPGAVTATLLWVVVSLVFKLYVANFADYNATYGAVGGVVVLLLWFYLSGLAILVGAEMNAERPWGESAWAEEEDWCGRRACVRGTARASAATVHFVSLDAAACRGSPRGTITCGADTRTCGRNSCQCLRSACLVARMEGKELSTPGLRKRAARLRLRRLSDGGLLKTHRDRRASPGSTITRHVASMSTDDRARDGQTQTRTAEVAAPGRVSAKKRLEDARHVSRRNAHSGVRHDELRAAGFLAQRQLHASARHVVLNRVCDDVGDGVDQSFGVS